MFPRKYTKDDNILTILQDTEYVTSALQSGINAALLQHKLAGNPICSWQDGKMVWIAPQDIPVDSNTLSTKIPSEILKQIAEGKNPIRMWREYRGISVSELADKASISRQYIHQLEHNQKTGSISLLKKIASILGVSLDSILTRQ